MKNPVSFDPPKSAKNAAERGLPFSRVEDFDWDRSVTVEDTRHAYPERRFVSLGFIGERLHVVCFTPVAGGGVRVISLRKANKREVKRYEQQAPDR